MVYPGYFHRLVVIGTMYGVETFNFTMSIVPTENPADVEAVDFDLANAVSAEVASWWDNAYGSNGVGIVDDARLVETKLNRIDSTGHYADNEVQTINVGTPIPGAAAGTLPAQLACAVTLRTARARGRGSRGRFYLPTLGVLGSLDTSGRLSTEQAQNVANGAGFLVDRINTVYWARDGGLRTMMMVGVASNIGAGIFEPATTVEVGRVPDTVRSRRSSLVEDHQVFTVPDPST